jgi:hypothetical protein
MNGLLCWIGGDADPRRFYFTVLKGLRVAQPRTPRTPLIGVGIDCDPEAGLYFEEEFNRSSLQNPERIKGSLISCSTLNVLELCIS